MKKLFSITGMTSLFIGIAYFLAGCHSLSDSKQTISGSTTSGSTTGRPTRGGSTPGGSTQENSNDIKKLKFKVMVINTGYLTEIFKKKDTIIFQHTNEKYSNGNGGRHKYKLVGFYRNSSGTYIKDDKIFTNSESEKYEKSLFNDDDLVNFGNIKLTKEKVLELATNCIEGKYIILKPQKMEDISGLNEKYVSYEMFYSNDNTHKPTQCKKSFVDRIYLNPSPPR